MIRVGVVCDLREENWPSMDLIADMLMEHLHAAGDRLVATRLCPPMARRWTKLPLVGGTARANLGDRLTSRLWDYPRWLARRARQFDVFHIVDHSYAHLVRSLPSCRAIVTCHDLDAVTFSPSRLLAARVLDGLARAAHVACVSETTRAHLLATGQIDPIRTSVVYVGVHPSCSPFAVPESDRAVEQQLGPRRLELLHVGSTIPRKRIETLLQILRGVRDSNEDVRLLRVGGPLTPAQRALAQKLNVAESIVELPFVDRPTLAALYRRASLVLLPSDREGFGLPLVEAMACSTPVVVSSIPSLREIGGSAAIYCEPGDTAAWVATISRLLRLQDTDPCDWQARKDACVKWSARFNWATYTAQMTRLYLETSLVSARAS